MSAAGGVGPPARRNEVAATDRAVRAGVPAGTRLVLAPGARRLGAGLIGGGSPWRLLRLTPAGDLWIDRWAAGAGVPDEPGVRQLARRLVEGGLAAPAPAPDTLTTVTVVVPCRDRADGLAATLDALDDDIGVVVVDDASDRPDTTRSALCGRGRTTLVEAQRHGGPAAARNLGWRDPAADGELIAFIDTDCLPPPGWTGALAGHFRDPAVGAVAPRIVARPAPPAPTWLAAYEAARSPLDLGDQPAPVRPRSTVPYVPTAALVVRRSALVELGGFDEELVTGEDVDFVWRLDRAGWSVRYDPGVVVDHPVRADLRSWWRQRAGYGRAAAPLAARHGRAVAPLAISRLGLLAWVLVGLRLPWAGAAVAVVAARRAGRTPASGPLPRRAIASIVLAGQLAAGRGLADALRRAWWPAALLAGLSSRRLRPALLAVTVLPPLLEWRRRRPSLDPATWTALRLADDLAYGAGVWSGVIRRRRAGCLLPDIS